MIMANTLKKGLAGLGLAFAVLTVLSIPFIDAPIFGDNAAYAYILNDNCETIPQTNWTFGGTPGFTQSSTRGNNLSAHSYFSGNVINMTSTMTSNVSFEVVNGTILKYYYWYNLQAGVDYVRMEISIDNKSTWTTWGTYTGNSSVWSPITFDLSTYAGKHIYLRFRAYSNNATNSGGFFVDDITIGAPPTIPGKPYLNLSSGTTPSITGTFEVSWDSSIDIGSNGLYAYQIFFYKNGSYDHWNLVSQPNTLIHYDNLSDGTYTFRAKAIDNGNYTSDYSPTSDAIVVNHPPTSEVRDWANPYTNNINGYIYASWQGSPDTTSFEIQYKYENGDWATWETTPAAITSGTFDAPGHGHGDGTWYFRSRAMDDLGWEPEHTALNGDAYMVLDRQLPNPVSASVFPTITCEAVTVSWPNPGDNGPSDIKYSWVRRLNLDGTVAKQWATWNGTLLTETLGSIGGPGSWKYDVRAIDNAGNLGPFSANSTTEVFTIDNTLPTGSVTINGGNIYTSSEIVTLSVPTNPDPTNVVQMRFRAGPTATWGSWVTYNNPTSFTFPTLQQGLRTIEAQYMDGAGNISTGTISDTITLDKTPPTGSINVNSGALYTTKEAVTLTLSASDTNPVVTMLLSNDGGSWTIYPYVTSKLWNLVPGDGLKTVSVKYLDGAGNESAVYTHSITLDATAPTGTISIAGGATYTTSNTVALNLSASDVYGVEKLSFRNPGGTWSSWYNYAATYSPWTMLTSNGVQTVEVQFKDYAGNISASVSDTIIYDNVAPTFTSSNFIIEGTAVPGYVSTYTNTTEVRFLLSASDATSGLASMEFSNTAAFAGNWENYSAIRSGWSLSSGDGLKTVYARVADRAGQKTPATPTVYKSITLDTAKPASAVNTTGTYNAATWTTYGTAIKGPTQDGISGIMVIKISLKRSSDNWYWNGTTWEAALVWNSAGSFTAGDTALKNWSYSIASSKFDNTVTYTVNSRATDYASIDQTTLGSNSFIYDNSGPVSAVNMGPAYSNDTWTAPATPIKGTAGTGAAGLKQVDIRIYYQSGGNYYYWNSSSWTNAGTSLPAGTGWLTAQTWASSPVKTSDTWQYSGSLSSGNLSNGITYIVQSRTTDQLINQQNPVTTDSFVYDNINPSAALTSPIGGNKYRGEITFTGTASDSVGLDYWKISYGSPKTQIISGSTTVNGAVLGRYDTAANPGIPDGTYNFYLFVRDWAGNTNEATVTSVVIDNTNPTTTLSISGPQVDPSSGWYTGPVTATLEATDALSGVHLIRYTITKPNNLSYMDSSATKKTLVIGPVGDPDGRYILTYYCDDNAGNVEEEKTVYLYIDKTSPSAPTITAPNGGVSPFQTKAANHTLSGTCTNDAVMVLVDGSASGVTFDPGTQTWSKDISLTAQGSRTFNITVKDASGRESAPTLFLFIYDTVGPVATISPPVTPIKVTSSTLSGTTENTDDTVLVKVNSGAWNSATVTGGTVTWNTTLNGLVAGQDNVIHVKAIDKLNNEGPERTANIYVDQIPPATPIITSVIPAVTNSTTMNINGTCDYSNFTATKQVTVKMFFNGGGSPVSTQTIVVSGSSWSAAETFGADGTYTFDIYATDFAGNDSVHVAPVPSVLKDTVNPTGTIMINAGADYANNTAVSLSLSADQGAGTQVNSMRFSNDGTHYSDWELFGAAKIWILSGEADGPRTVYVQFRDLAMNISAARSASITLDMTPPTISDVILNGHSLADDNPNPAVDYKVTNPTPFISIATDDNYTDFGSNPEGVVVEFVRGNTVERTLSGALNFSVADNDPLPVDKYTLRMTVTDLAGNSTVEEISGIIVAGGDPVLTTRVIASPSPFNPLSGGTAKIWFTVSADPNAVVAVYLHDITGRLVWKRTYLASQLMVDKKVEWNGYNDFNEVAGNGVYLVRVVDETNKKLIGKTKIIIIKSK